VKNEPWRGDPAARCRHLERKLANKRVEILRLRVRALSAEARMRVMDEQIKLLRAAAEPARTAEAK